MSDLTKRGGKRNMKPLWMPLYIEKFLADTAHMTVAQCGAYIHLLCHMWRSDDGTLPNNDAKLASCARVGANNWSRIRPAINNLLDVDGDRVTNTDLQAELGKANAKIVLARAAASLGGIASSFRRGAQRESVSTLAKTLMPPKPLKTNNAPQADAQASAQHNYNKNIREEGEGSSSPLPRKGEASDEPNKPTKSSLVERPKEASKEEVGLIPTPPTDSAIPESPLLAALQRLEASRKKHGGGRE